MSAFENIRIVDFSQGIAGPMATMLLSDFGARVVKVEPPTGDRLKDHPGYLCWNRNKEVVRLDPGSYDGVTTAKRLIAGADIAVFDGVPGELERIGLDAASLLPGHPRLVHCWMPPHGTGGRWSHLPPDDLLLSATSGVAHMQLSFEDRPVWLVTPQLSYAHGTIAANAIAAALIERQRSGRGQALTVSGLHAVTSVESSGLLSTGGAVRLARSSRGAAHYGLYECADGQWFFLGCLTQAFLFKALDVLDAMDILADERVNGEFTNLLMPAGAAYLRERLAAIFITKPRDHWMTFLGEHGVPKGPAGDRHEWFQSETVAANSMRVMFEDVVRGQVEIPGVGAVLEETPGSVRHLPKPAKLEEVLATWPALADNPVDVGPGPGGGALAGIRVLDLGAIIAGPFSSVVLANFGADVIKIEPPGGEQFRPYGLGFLGFNSGKRAIVLDLKRPEGRDAFEQLVRTVDVVIDNFRLGVPERIGTDFATLSKINPRIIVCSVTGYGRKGPLAADPGFDPLLQARSGMMAAQGGNDEPVFHQIAVNDSASAMMAAFGILAALHARERTGRGQEVHTCLANQSVLFQSGELVQFPGRIPPPTGGRDFLGTSALRRFYECSDGWICLAATEAKHFHDVALGLGHQEWAGRYVAEKATLEGPESDLARAIADALRGIAVAEALDRLRTRGVPAAPVLRLEDAFSDPWLEANDFFWHFESPQFGPVIGAKAFAKWGRSTGGFPRRAPMLGEHSLEILREAGVDESAIDVLLASGATTQWEG